jgi:hypothetical protein
VALSRAPDGGVAGHVAYGVQINGKTNGFLPQPRSGQGGFDSGVACANNRDIVFSGVKFSHRDSFVPLRGGACNLRPCGPLRFFLLSLLKDVSFRPCGAAPTSNLFLASPLAGAGAFFSRERKEAKDHSRNYVP